jgi:hypothetical protein
VTDGANVVYVNADFSCSELQGALWLYDGHQHVRLTEQSPFRFDPGFRYEVAGGWTTGPPVRRPRCSSAIRTEVQVFVDGQRGLTVAARSLVPSARRILGRLAVAPGDHQIRSQRAPGESQPLEVEGVIALRRFNCPLWTLRRRHRWRRHRRSWA